MTINIIPTNIVKGAKNPIKPSGLFPTINIKRKLKANIISPIAKIMPFFFEILSLLFTIFFLIIFIFYFLLGAGIEPARSQGPADFKSAMSTNSIIRANQLKNYTMLL